LKPDVLPVDPVLAELDPVDLIPAELDAEDDDALPEQAEAATRPSRVAAASAMRRGLER
jgi:hypothetical protein